MLSLLLPERCSVIKYDQVSLLSPFPPGYFFFFLKLSIIKGGKRGRKSPASSALLCRALVWMLWWDRTLLDPPLPIPPSLLAGMRNNLFFGSNRSNGRNPPPPPSGRVGKNLDGFCGILSGSQGDTRPGFLHWGGCWALLEFPFIPFFFILLPLFPAENCLQQSPAMGKWDEAEQKGQGAIDGWSKSWSQRPPGSPWAITLLLMFPTG